MVGSKLAGVAPPVMSLVELVERVADGELGGDLGDGKPVALEASAESARRAGSSR
jgi:hypothetical protein